MQSTAEPTIAVIGGGVSGQMVGIFTGRHGLETTIYDAGNSLLRRNAHLENFPGFPLGINARQLLELIGEQVEQAGCSMVNTQVESVRTTDQGFSIEPRGAATATADIVVAATKNETAPFEGIEGVEILDRGKTFIDVDDRGRTGVDGFYAAGRLAGEPHQAVVSAGHGAKVGVTILEDIDRPFYHDWVAPKGYFTGRDREVPPGCEEIDDDERISRERRAIELLQERFAAPHLEPPRQHPSVASDEQ